VEVLTSCHSKQAFAAICQIIKAVEALAFLSQATVCFDVVITGT
jgi:hypothetical protein